MIRTDYIDKKSKLKQETFFLLAQILWGSLFIALCAQIRIPLPFTIVPVTLQTLAVMLIGGFLGARNGALCILLYLAESMLGIPVLSGFRIDPLALFSPIGGYLLGFIGQAYITGFFVEKEKTDKSHLHFFGLILGSFFTLFFGAFFLSFFVGFNQILMMGVIPFIPGEILKICAASSILSRYGIIKK